MYIINSEAPFALNIPPPTHPHPHPTPTPYTYRHTQKNIQMIELPIWLSEHSLWNGAATQCNTHRGHAVIVG